MKRINKLRQMLKDFTPFEPKSDKHSKFVNILTGNYNPPSYVVQMLLLGVLGFKNYGKMDKVLWHTYLQYKNYPFMIRDYKFGTWTIEGIQNNEEMLQLAKEIKNKIIKASKALDKVLCHELKTEIERGNFYLNNVYYKLNSIYTFYEEKVLKTIKEYENFEEEIKLKKKPKEIISLAEYFNSKMIYEKTISNYSFALILSFFSLLEFLLDVIYAFEQPNKNFSEFKKDKWDSRFKLVFHINESIKIKDIYDELVNIKKRYRNPLAHGLTNEANLLVPLPFVGLVPISYRYILNNTYYGPTEIDKDDALNIIETFKKFLKFIKDEEPYNFYILYLDYGFSIPMDKKDILDIKGKMITYRDFKKYLDEKSFYEDMVINREI